MFSFLRSLKILLKTKKILNGKNFLITICKEGHIVLPNIWQLFSQNVSVISEEKINIFLSITTLVLVLNAILYVFIP